MSIVYLRLLHPQHPQKKKSFYLFVFADNKPIQQSRMRKETNNIFQINKLARCQLFLSAQIKSEH